MFKIRNSHPIPFILSGGTTTSRLMFMHVAFAGSLRRTQLTYRTYKDT